MDNEQISVPSGKEVDDPQTHLLPGDLHLPAGGVGAEPNELVPKLPTCSAEERLDVAENINQSIAERHERIDDGADEGATPRAEGRPRRSGEGRPSASYQPSHDRPSARSVSPAFHDDEKQSPRSRLEVASVLGGLIFASIIRAFPS
jgi:hypothetical protein